MTIELDANQTEFMDVLARNEMGMNHGGIITIVENNFRIEEIMFSHIVRRKAINEKINAPRENTLIVAPFAWKNQWEERIKKFNVNIPILFYKKGCTDSQKVLCNEVIITTFHALFDLKEQLPHDYWKRLIFYDTNDFIPSKEQFKRFYKIKALYRWCITSDPTQHCLAGLFYIGKNGRAGYSIDDCLKQERVDFLGFTPMMTHEDYIKNADTAAKRGNMIQFSNNLWNAVFSFTNSFYVEKFKMNVENYENLEDRFERFCAGRCWFTPSDAADLMRLWVNVEWNYLECDQDNFFISINNMKETIEQLKKLIGLIQKADITLIGNAVGIQFFTREK